MNWFVFLTSYVEDQVLSVPEFVGDFLTGDNKLQLVFNAPKENGGKPISQYIIS